jgi:[ribosomal protein S5]-alanine N-acetyltransferase
MLDIKFKPFPNLASDRLFLRAIVKDDKEEIFALRSNPAVMKYICRPPAQSVEEAEAFINKITKDIKEKDLLYWGITLKVDNTLIGTICLWNISRENHRAELGYELMPEFHGQGLMQEAFTKVVDYAFNTLKFHSLEANVDPRNKKSIHLLKRNDFVREAYFKENIVFNGKFLDTAIYAKINPKEYY